MLGAPLQAAAQALGESLADSYDTFDHPCDYLTPMSLPAGASLMVVSDTVVRVDVDTATIATAEGIRVGDTDVQIRDAYSGRVRDEPHAYTNGRYFIVTPADASDSAFRLVFETYEGRVARYRAGRLPEVQWVEGCS